MITEVETLSESERQQRIRAEVSDVDQQICATYEQFQRLTEQRDEACQPFEEQLEALVRMWDELSDARHELAQQYYASRVTDPQELEVGTTYLCMHRYLEGEPVKVLETWRGMVFVDAGNGERFITPMKDLGVEIPRLPPEPHTRRPDLPF